MDGWEVGQRKEVIRGRSVAGAMVVDNERSPGSQAASQGLTEVNIRIQNKNGVQSANTTRILLAVGD